MDDARHIQIHGFLINLFDCYSDGWIEMRCIRKPAIEQFWYSIETLKDKPYLVLCEVSEKALEMDAKGWDVYVGVLPRAEQTGKAQFVWHACWTFADLDFEKQSEAECLKRLERKPPTMLVATGGGLHAYWKFDEPTFLDKKRRVMYRKAMEGLIAVMGADPGAKDEARVLRLPGTRNHKPERNGAAVRLVRCEPSPWAVVDSARDTETARVVTARGAAVTGGLYGRVHA